MRGTVHTHMQGGGVDRGSAGMGGWGVGLRSILG